MRPEPARWRLKVKATLKRTKRASDTSMRTKLGSSIASERENKETHLREVLHYCAEAEGRERNGLGPSSIIESNIEGPRLQRLAAKFDETVLGKLFEETPPGQGKGGKT